MKATRSLGVVRMDKLSRGLRMQWNLDMATATLASHHLHFCFSKFSITNRRRQVRLTYPNRNPLSIVFCSSSTSPPPPSEVSEPSTPTAESCVNVGLDLFSKGRVFSYFFSQFHCCNSSNCFMVIDILGVVDIKWINTSSFLLLISGGFTKLYPLYLKVTIFPLSESYGDRLTVALVLGWINT